MLSEGWDREDNPKKSNPFLARGNKIASVAVGRYKNKRGWEESRNLNKDGTKKDEFLEYQQSCTKPQRIGSESSLTNKKRRRKGFLSEQKGGELGNR